VICYPFAVGDVVTRVIEAGSGDRTVVLCHGVGARADRWRDTLPALADGGFRAFAIDFPGHGFATKGPGFDYTVPSYADFVGAFLAALGAQRAILVGTSMGGHTMATLAARRPELCEALVMVGPTGLVELGSQARAVIADSIARADPESTARKLRTLVHDPGLITPEWIREESMINNSPGAAHSFEALAGYFRDRIDQDVVAEQLASVAGRFPVSFVWGRQDPFVPLEIGVAAHERVAGSRLAVLDKTGHAPYLERPEAFNRALAEILRGSATEPAKDVISLLADPQRARQRAFITGITERTQTGRRHETQERSARCMSNPPTFPSSRSAIRAPPTPGISVSSGEGCSRFPTTSATARRSAWRRSGSAPSSPR
jgi:2-hydroxy-6-oxonona-2,4-dienedioate hydrolase